MPTPLDRPLGEKLTLDEIDERKREIIGTGLAELHTALAHLTEANRLAAYPCRWDRVISDARNATADAIAAIFAAGPAVFDIDPVLSRHPVDLEDDR